MGYLDNAGLQHLWDRLKEKFAQKSHSHDDRYYTESEMDAKLSAKAANIVLAHNANLNDVTTPGFYSCGRGNSILNKPTGVDAIGLIVTHNASGNYYTQILTTSSNANTYRRTCLNGSWSGWTQDKYTDTNTWRGIQNNLTSDSTSDSLSAAQGKVLKGLVDGKAPTSHKHTKSQITDFPTSMPASDVSAWAKAPTKPTYTKAEVGLGNVDNTADKDKSVKYATSAANATNTQYLNNDSQYMRFHWNGQSGQPTWLWGGNDASNMYVYNPSNFSVNYATTAGNGTSTTLFNSGNESNTENEESCVRFGNGLQICWGFSNKSTGAVFKLPFANAKYAAVCSGGDSLKNAWYVSGSRTTTGFKPGQDGFAVWFHWIAIGRWK